jgi:hypothetical protein
MLSNSVALAPRGVCAQSLSMATLLCWPVQLARFCVCDLANYAKLQD